MLSILTRLTLRYGTDPHPQSATVWSNLASWHETAGDMVKAVECYSRWAEMLQQLNPDSPEVRAPWDCWYATVSMSSEHPKVYCLTMRGPSRFWGTEAKRGGIG